MKKNSNNFYGIKEERQFTNPRVRFRRIRGRIVPIFNKKKIGKDFDRVGGKAIKAGATLGAVSVGYTVAKKSAKAMGFSINSNSPAKKFLKAKNFTKSKALVRAAKKISQIGLSKKTALGFVAGGFAARSVGFELQAESAFGYDFGGDK